MPGGEAKENGHQGLIGRVAKVPPENGYSHREVLGKARHNMSSQGGWQQPDWGCMASGYRTQWVSAGSPVQSVSLQPRRKEV